MDNHNTIRRHHRVTNISNNIRGDKENIAPQVSHVSQPLLPNSFGSIPNMDITSVPFRDTTSRASNPMTEARKLRKMIMNNKEQYIQRKGSTASTRRVINPSLQQNSHQYTLCNSNSNSDAAAHLSTESLSTRHEIHGTQQSVTNSASEARKRRRLIINNKKANDGCVQFPNITQQPSVANTNASINRRTPLRDVTIGSGRQTKYRKGVVHADAQPSHRNSMDDDITNSDNKRFSGISSAYVDIGDATYECSKCGAMLWELETKRGMSQSQTTAFSLCCLHGKVKLEQNREPVPPLLLNLLSNNHPLSKHYIQNIRRYNMMFSFTSMGGKVDESINKGKGPYIYRIQGQNFHRMGSLVPVNSTTPKFCQLYIYDTENEVSNRIKASTSKTREGSNKKKDQLNPVLIRAIKALLDEINPLVKQFRLARDLFSNNVNERFKIKLLGKRAKDGRNYNLPEADEVAALIVGDLGVASDNRDIVIQSHEGELQRISELHVLYLGLQYPLIFARGEDGFRVDIAHEEESCSRTKKKKKVTMREWFAYRIQERNNGYSLLLNARKLFQQFLVDAFTMVETQRLNFMRREQKKLRCASYSKLNTAVDNGQTNTSDIGKRIYLPSSYTGGARYMVQNYLDAMAICKYYGYPDLFITFTCNTKWPEINRFMAERNLKSEDRPEVVSRVFKMKLDTLIKDLKTNKLFGRVEAVVYTVEFQKRGLPHSHICLFLHANDKLPNPEHIDRVISAEIPDKFSDPELYELVSDCMMHGPCGPGHTYSPCMKDKKTCSKKFPRKFCEQTTVDEDGYPVYRRRDNGRTVTKSGTELDNRYVVGYNEVLLKKYQAHINVEWCNQVGSIKYLFKYINKGHDRATAVVVDEEVDEIKEYYDCRYVSSCEAAWRIFQFDIHERTPPVERLPFHLPGEQSVYFDEGSSMEDIINNQSVNQTMFTEWMEANKIYDDAKKLTYVEFPTKFVWKQEIKKWMPRKKGFSLGRVHHISPSAGDLYFFRILLNKQKGPTSWEKIRTVDGVLFKTNKDACYAMGLLDDDREYIDGIKEASFWGAAHYLRSMFVMLITSDSVSRAEHVWEATWTMLAEDMESIQRRRLDRPGLELSDEQKMNLTLCAIEKLLRKNGTSLKQIPNMPYPDLSLESQSINRLVEDELSYSLPKLNADHSKMVTSLTDEQKNAYDKIMMAVDKNTGGVFFLYGYGGTGKTFVWKTLSAAIRRRRDIVLNVASSGIAALLLPGGRTAHSRFAIPININEDSTCCINIESDLAGLIRKTKLIIWDEAPMVNKHCFEALDRTLKDIMRSSKPFGGIVVVFGGDFRQILPVIPRGTRSEIVNASLRYSYIWYDIQVLKLTENMRLRVGNNDGESEETKAFADWILSIGNGEVGEDKEGEAEVEIPNEILIKDTSGDPVDAIINAIYPDVVANLSTRGYFEDRAILAPTNDVVNKINERMMQLIPTEEHVYLSSDTISPCEVTAGISEDLYSPDFLNKLQLSGLPNHILKLKKGVPVMLLRNIDQQAGLCNGTRLLVRRMGLHVVEAEIITGTNVGDITFIPRMRLNSSDKRMPLQFYRRQFPLAVCFAMTINKSQGQSLSQVGLFLERPVFSHGQLYVALSRVRSKNGLRVVICDEEGQTTNTTTNVVFKEVLQGI